MNSRRSLLAPVGLSLLLGSCNLYTVTPPPNAEVTVTDGKRTPYTQALSGSWEVDAQPSWLELSRTFGQGDINFDLTPRNVASCSAQSGEVTILWNKDLVGKGSTTLRVNYTPYNGSTTSLESRSRTQNPDLGIIVRYRSSAAARKALARGLSIQGVGAVSGSSESRRILLSGVSLEQILADPEVESAFPNAPLHAIRGTEFPDTAVPFTSTSSRLSTQSVFTPPDQYYPLQWAFRALEYPSVWASMLPRLDLRPVMVAVLDGGIRYDQPDLKGHLVLPGEGALDVVGLTPATSDGFGPDDDPTDPSAPVSSNGNCTGTRLYNSSHGTHVAGIIVAGSGEFPKPCAACSSSGVVGAALAAPVKVLPIRVINMRDNADVFGVSSAIRYVAGEPLTLAGKTYTNPLAGQTRVINLSLGGTLSENSSTAKELCSAVSFARSRGILVVAAAGNEGVSSLLYPAACADAVSVGSVGLKNEALEFERASYSDMGPTLTLSAPGGNGDHSFNGATLGGQPFADLIFSTDWDFNKSEPKYESKQGTSQATPQVAALAALIWSSGLESSANGVLERMERTALDLGAVGQDPQYGYGVIQPRKALEIAP